MARLERKQFLQLIPLWQDHKENNKWVAKQVVKHTMFKIDGASIMCEVAWPVSDLWKVRGEAKNLQTFSCIGASIVVFSRVNAIGITVKR